MAKIMVASQDFDIFNGDNLDSFARTGDISLSQLERAGAQGIILGHSEVGDSPETINKKLLTIASKASWVESVVVLVGEAWEEFEKFEKESVAKIMRNKCKTVFRNVPKKLLSKVTVGYEPKWGSRGSGRDDMPPPQPELISECVKDIKAFFEEKGTNPLCIYGGRSTPERTEQILSDDNVNGLILGSACNSIEKTMAIAEKMQKVSKGTKVLICNFKAYDLPDPYDEYVRVLKELPDDFIVQLAPPYTEIKEVRVLLV